MIPIEDVHIPARGTNSMKKWSHLLFEKATPNIWDQWAHEKAINVHKPPIQTQAVNLRCASGPQSSSNEWAIELAGVETAAVKITSF